VPPVATAPPEAFEPPRAVPPDALAPPSVELLQASPIAKIAKLANIDTAIKLLRTFGSL
jgi:hypothetical protein